MPDDRAGVGGEGDGVNDINPRWLTPEQAASYVGRHRDELPRLVRSGKLPSPSYHFGPRSPRYDREALDALFTGAVASRSIDLAEQEAVNAIVQRANQSRQKASRRQIGRAHV